MPSDSLFSRSNNENGPDDPAEGVRLINAEEAEEAIERGDTVKRRGNDRPRYGDRPAAPSAGGTSPSLRFPLADATDPSSIERPRAAPVQPRRASGSMDQPPERPERPEPPQPEPVISVEPATGETELPHWTEPATGEVPRVIIGDVDAGDDQAEAERWASFAGSGGPRWRDVNDDWDAGDIAALGEGVEDEEPLGALDTQERPTQEEFLTFDDLDVPAAEAPRAAPRGSADDPIRIQSSQARPPGARPVPEGGRAPSGGTAARRSAARESARRPPAEERPRPEGEDAGSGSGGRDVPMAVFVGVAIAAVALIIFKIGPAATVVLATVVVTLAGVELFGAIRQGGFRPATLLGLAAIVTLPLATYWRGEAAMPLVIFLTVAFSMLWFLLGIGGHAKVLPNLGVTLFGVLYVGMFGAFAALILRIPAQGVSILLVTVVGAVFYDIGGFFLGRRFGRTPLSAVSPNKTVEGLVGGLACSLLATLAFAGLLGFGPFSFGQALVFGVFVALAAPFGDLAESLLKRDLGVKDMGTLLPQHGGILDRFDGILFVLPTAYYLVRTLGLA